MAATSNLTLNALLNVSYGTFTRGTDMQKAIEQFTKNGAVAGIKAANKAGEKDTKSAWMKTHGEMLKFGLKKQADAFKKETIERFRNEQKIIRQRKILEAEIERTKGTAAEKAFKEQKNKLDQRLKQEKKARALMESIAMKETQARMALIEAHDEKMNKTRAESMKETGDSIQAAIGGAFSADSLDLAGITESLGGMLTGGLESAAGAAGAAGNAGAMAGLSTAAAGIAAVVGPLVAIAGVMAMAYNQTKEMNKELLSTTSTFDLVGTSLGDLNARLTDIRLEIQAVAYDMRLSGEEVMVATNALSEAGITFREFTDITEGASGKFASFQDVLRSSIKSAYGLGLEVSEVAEYYAKMGADLGYNLDQIEGSFGLIAEQAQLAGMRTKDFFGAVTQAGTGMALYNFRIGDTATLLTELVKILGEDEAKTKIGLEGTFRGMGMQEKYKQAMLGGDKFSGAVKADMRAQAGKYSETLKGTEGAEGLKKSGIVGEKGQINTRALATMSGKAFREALETSGLTDTQKRQLVTLKTLSQAEKGRMGVAEASGALSKRGELAAQMAQGSEMFGGKLLSDLHGVERMMAEEVTGRSGEEYDLLSRIQLSMTAQYEQLKKNGDPRVQGKTFEEAVTEGLLNASEEDVNKIVNKKHFSEVEKAARAQLKETRSISQTVTNVIQALLGRIAVGVEMLTNFFAEGDEVGQAKDSSDSLARQEKLSESISALDASISDKQMKLSGSTDTTEREKLAGEISAAEAEIAAKRKALSDEEDVHRSISRGKSAGQSREALMKEKYGSQMAALTPDMLKAAGLGSHVRSIRKMTMSDLKMDRKEGTGEKQEYLQYAEMSTEEQEQLVALFEQQLTDEAAKTEQDKQADIDQSLRDEKAGKQSEGEHAELVKTLQEMDQRKALAQLGSYLEVSSDTLENALKGDAKALATIDAAMKEKGVTEGLAMLYAETGLAGTYKPDGTYTPGKINAPSFDEERRNLSDEENNTENSGYTPPWGLTPAPTPEIVRGPVQEDFIYRGDGTRGTINPIDTADQFIGLKPGGAIDEAFAGASGGGKAVIININGGDEARIYTIVKKVLMETGYSGMKSY